MLGGPTSNLHRRPVSYRRPAASSRCWRRASLISTAAITEAVNALAIARGRQLGLATAKPTIVAEWVASTAAPTSVHRGLAPSADDGGLEQVSQAEHAGECDRAGVDLLVRQGARQQSWRQHEHRAVGDAQAGQRAHRIAYSVAKRCCSRGAFEQQRVDERLRQVAAQLALGDVELLGEEAGRAAGGAVALEPAGGGHRVALLGVGERRR